MVGDRRWRSKIVVLRQATTQALSPGDLDRRQRRGAGELARLRWLLATVDGRLRRHAAGAPRQRRAAVRAQAPLAARHGRRRVGLVTDDVGPAVVGLLRPRIVVPRWVTMALPSHQAAVIAHEQSHLDARDPQLFTLALALLVFMPWNLPLWWQLRRLRYAIEIDCDARVLEGRDGPHALRRDADLRG